LIKNRNYGDLLAASLRLRLQKEDSTKRLPQFEPTKFRVRADSGSSGSSADQKIAKNSGVRPSPVFILHRRKKPDPRGGAGLIPASRQRAVEDKISPQKLTSCAPSATLDHGAHLVQMHGVPQQAAAEDVRAVVL
jgi:hypothetical protein